ncbi:MAG: phosphoglucosamine mutase [Candidatus Neomarinimicrobiota bacterium]|nr:MAG: phosphoglucosamine mutase [Candidatus Neomarinimicrobiota bacterium]
MLIRSASGLRGVVEDDFNSGIIDQYITSFILTQKITYCVLGRDGRQSGKEMSQWVVDSLTKYGVNVDNCDLATTPTMQLMTEKEQYNGGIVITASHNPTEYNGLKFLQKDGTFLSPDQCDKLFASVDNEDVLDKAEVAGKASYYNSADEEHINKVLSASCIEPDKIHSKKMKVVIDAVNGAGSTILPQLCRELGCDVETINCNGDGNFTRIPEPLAHNLKDLENKVLEVGADIGFATDPDGDRLSIVSNKGKAIGEEYTLVLAFKNFINHQKSMIVTNLSTSKMIDDISSGSIRTKIGEAHVVQKMKELNISIGGEGNGGVILEEVHLGRDSLVAVAMVLNLLDLTNQSINEIIAEIPEYVFLKDKITLNDSKDVDFDNLATLFDCDEINRDDGIKFSWSKKWIHIRKSNTEPIIRIFAEAKTESEVNSLIQTLKDYLK